jgi:hypothetical protein
MRTKSAALGRTIAGALVWALLLAVAPAGWAGALVTDARGQVEAVGGGKPALLSELAPGAVLRLGAGAQVTLLVLDNGDEFTMKGPGKYQLASQGLIVLEGSKAVRRTLPVPGAASVQLRAGDGAQATLVLRGADNPFRLTSPVDTAVIADRPTFRWAAAESGAAYRFTLLDDASAQVFQAETTDTRLDLPAAIRLRDGGAYSWTVEVVASGRRKRAASGEFAVVDVRTRAALERLRPRRDAPFSDRVAYALVLEQHNVRDTAQEQWRKLAAERPGEPNLQQRVER